MPRAVAALDRITVVIPVRNEERLLAAAIEHVRAAMDRWDGRRIPRAGLILVLDSCTDASAQIAATAASADPRIRSIPTDVGSVGAARALGVRAALEGTAQEALRRHWIANTDADTRVPPDWLELFAQAADAGADALLGTCEPDAQELGRDRYDQWQRFHARKVGHPHIHGANLGVRASAYLDAGGFNPVAGDEDVQLIEALRARAAEVRSDGALHVVTSGRLQGRVRHGFADFLAHLPGCASR